jgi:hypothetical protein
VGGGLFVQPGSIGTNEKCDLAATGFGAHVDSEVRANARDVERGEPDGVPDAG